MSLLLADSGATKTTWARVEKDHQQIVITSGMNPNLKVDRELESVVYDELFAQLSKNELTHVYFYGAGTGEVNTAGRLEKILQEAFLNCEIHVGTDIEAAGLSTFGNESGVVAISGTGSGAAMMNNGKVEKVMNARSFPEGDFGSGAHIGSLILKDFFAGSAPVTIRELIDENRKLSIEDLFVQFQDPMKSKMIAAKAMKDVATLGDIEGHTNRDYLKDLVHSSLTLFMTQLKHTFGINLTRFPLRFVGTTAWYFEDIFIDFFKNEQVNVDLIEKDPINGMMNYHRNML
ncbi:MAG TPA: hypothetical protein DEQ34_00695 [Balneolaceae bacterium]|mgnify:CR=1 FL=1|nr:hypothetical protein [Balneolaceae bacterium]|tara:strand:- start:264246 stop:265112 length:867 start_codon:yes stop_codon:yes gene_type:complete